LIPGYYRAVPPDKSHSPIEAPHNYLSAYGVYPGIPWDSQNNVLSTGRFEVEDFAKQIRRFNARTAGA
jgi:hypothetical protein